MSTMLKVDNINVYYGAIHAVKNVSFPVEEGDMIFGAPRNHIRTEP